MKKLIFPALCLLGSFLAEAEIKVTDHKEGWDNIPPEAIRPGYYFQKSVLVQMDDDPALEEVMLFGHDYGHYPTFDLFKAYYAVVDNFTKKIEYISESEYVTDRFDLTVEDRDNDGIHELYITYFKDGQFTVDERGYNLRAVRCHDRIQFIPDRKPSRNRK